MTKRGYFRTNPEITGLAMMMYVWFLLSLRNVEGVRHERGIEESHESVRFWWRRFGLMFAADLRRKWVAGLRTSRWRWHLDREIVKIDGVHQCL